MESFEKQSQLSGLFRTRVSLSLSLSLSRSLAHPSAPWPAALLRTPRVKINTSLRRLPPRPRPNSTAAATNRAPKKVPRLVMDPSHKGRLLGVRRLRQQKNPNSPLTWRVPRRGGSSDLKDLKSAFPPSARLSG
jgi:hypothetical protein